MKKILALMLLSIFITACSLKNSPKYVSEGYTKALEQNDLRKARSYIYVPSSIQSYMSSKDIEEQLGREFSKFQKELEGIAGLKKFKIVQSKEISDTVTELIVECIGNNGQIIDKSFYTVNIDGVWKLIQDVK
ncbi:DUF4878 domain-containing protein [Campylobacter troglodytis]|uniref:DUF4878 domain-containing protein n=1 Tax=Campylobacter troglodytis TaxID=654363 RepID=UPI001158A496|nr:DUF4878 domain-containing protein [Campylobacter troglodytis]TQR60783.1 hypothetical protein DMC01_04000 [Campylobacter troglodytis]